MFNQTLANNLHLTTAPFYHAHSHPVALSVYDEPLFFVTYVRHRPVPLALSRLGYFLLPRYCLVTFTTSTVTYAKNVSVPKTATIYGNSKMTTIDQMDHDNGAVSGTHKLADHYETAN